MADLQAAREDIALSALALIEARLRGSGGDMDLLLDHADLRGTAFLLAGLCSFLLTELYPGDPAEAVAAMRPVFLQLPGPAA